jgi:hypothetical protein
MRHLEFQHHDRNDDSQHAIAEGLEPIFAHGPIQPEREARGKRSSFQPGVSKLNEKYESGRGLPQSKNPKASPCRCERINYDGHWIEGLTSSS